MLLISSICASATCLFLSSDIIYAVSKVDYNLINEYVKHITSYHAYVTKPICLTSQVISKFRRSCIVTKETLF